MNDKLVVPTSIKIPKGLLDLIDADVEKNGDFRNRSEWMIEAFRNYLNERVKIVSEREKIFGKRTEIQKENIKSIVIKDIEEEGK